mmetsp:Transcript_31585/g.75709  ORF Transcript_31585/g.75709 Transcript_31585/m.75709 type:complete len:349 (-) Transcript_31585:165-1211(-)
MGLVPPLWVELWDAATLTPYYFNVETGQSSWSDPAPEAISFGAATRPILPPVKPPAGDPPQLGDKLFGTGAKPRQTKSGVLPPARQQVKPTENVGYVEGFDEFNAWYQKYENDRFNKKDREPATHTCNPEMDVGWTQADLKLKAGKKGSVFCIYFAMGRCNKGHMCQYYHRIPTPEDQAELESAVDIFGRTRFGTDKEDMGGVGNFMRDQRTLFVTDYTIPWVRDPIGAATVALRKLFSRFGELDEVRALQRNGVAFVRYKHRCSAEFAKIALNDQKIDNLTKRLTVRWAADHEAPQTQKAPAPGPAKPAVDTSFQRQLDTQSWTALEKKPMKTTIHDTGKYIGPALP